MLLRERLLCSTLLVAAFVSASSADEVLENEYIRASVSEKGGKIVSLIDKKTQREYAFTHTPPSPALDGMGKVRLLESPRDMGMGNVTYTLKKLGQGGKASEVNARATAASPTVLRAEGVSLASTARTTVASRGGG